MVASASFAREERNSSASANVGMSLRCIRAQDVESKSDNHPRKVPDENFHFVHDAAQAAMGASQVLLMPLYNFQGVKAIAGLRTRDWPFRPLIFINEHSNRNLQNTARCGSASRGCATVGKRNKARVLVRLMTAYICPQIE
jgi:hypothetical protein